MTAILELGYLVVIFSFIIGLKLLSKPNNGFRGNAIAAGGMVLAVVLTFISSFQGNFISLPSIITIVALLIAGIVGKVMSAKVGMIEMPQLISFFNATGGACAILIGFAVLVGSGVVVEGFDIAFILLAYSIIIGGLTFTGSLVAYYKLSTRLNDWKSNSVIVLSRIMFFVLALSPIILIFGFSSDEMLIPLLVIGILSLVYGIYFVMPIGGADMPVVISLLNSLSGIATALSGMYYDNRLMISGGIIVGASGVILTILMCKSMNRSLWKVLKGKFNNSTNAATEDKEQAVQTISISDLLMNMVMANKVGIIPGYGLAVAQAQHVCYQIQKRLEERGTEVNYIIHPVAGRMPGHMNVLLAEAEVSYGNLIEMDDANDTINQYDLLLVIGANDVVNPSAEDDPNSPIFGMPIIKAYEAKRVVIFKRGMSKGYSGVVNPLFERSNILCFLGMQKKIWPKSIVN